MHDRLPACFRHHPSIPPLSTGDCYSWSDHRKPVQGFTLIEILIVLTIAGIAMALVAPNLSVGLGSIQLRSAAREIASSLRYSRGRAISRATETEFNINVETNVYQISGKNKNYTIPGEIRLGLVTANSEITGQDSGTIRFFPDGSSTGGGVTLETGNRKRRVDVNWLTGHVEVLAEMSE